MTDTDQTNQAADHEPSYKVLAINIAKADADEWKAEIAAWVDRTMRDSLEHHIDAASMKPAPMSEIETLISASTLRAAPGAAVAAQMPEEVDAVLVGRDNPPRQPVTASFTVNTKGEYSGYGSIEAQGVYVTLQPNNGGAQPEDVLDVAIEYLEFLCNQVAASEAAHLRGAIWHAQAARRAYLAMIPEPSFLADPAIVSAIVAEARLVQEHGPAGMDALTLTLNEAEQAAIRLSHRGR